MRLDGLQIKGCRMVQKFEYKKATLEDIDELVRTRIIVLRAANKLSDDEDMSVVEKESYAYYRRALETGEHIAFHTLDLLMNDATKQGVLQIALEATDMGRPLYERYGFVKMEDEMELKL